MAFARLANAFVVLQLLCTSIAVHAVTSPSPAPAPSHPHPHPHPTHPPLKPPVQPPVPPVKPPVVPPVKPPVAPPVKPPVAPPVKPPVAPPVKPPVKPPVAPPVKPPVAPPVKPPVAPPVKPPVKPPVAPPVKPPSHPPHPAKNAAVQGVVYCKSCKYRGIDTLLKASPLAGAVVKLVCHDTKYRVVEQTKTDNNGYFFFKPKQLTTATAAKCRVFLISSPLAKCSVPNNLHGGATGAVPIPAPKKKPPSSFVLYNVGPFAFEAHKKLPCHF